MGKKKNGPIIKKGLDEWMATYSDMVTLLFCFFVLLYASSTQEETRFQYIFQAFSTGGEYINTIVGKQPDNAQEGDGTKNSDIPPVIEDTSGTGAETPAGTGDDPDSFSTLFSALQAIIDSESLADTVSVDGSGGQVKLLFDKDVLFEPDSYVLKESGKEVLNLLIPGIKTADDYIANVIVQGHVAKITGVSPVNDWELSSMRAATVTKYLDNNKATSAEKLKSEGHGSNEPIDDSDTIEARAKNRRVEIIINRSKEKTQSTEVFMAIMEYDYNQRLNQIDEDGNLIDGNFLNKDDVISEIANAIDSKYSEKLSQDAAASQSAAGPSANDMLTIPESEYVVTSDTESAEANAETTPETSTDATVTTAAG